MKKTDLIQQAASYFAQASVILMVPEGSSVESKASALLLGSRALQVLAQTDPNERAFDLAKQTLNQLFGAKEIEPFEVTDTPVEKT